MVLGVCQAIASASKDLPTVDVLFDAIVARSAPQGASTVRLPGSHSEWFLPIRQTLPMGTVSFENWHYNPEVGFPMPETVKVAGRQDQPGFSLDLQRFYLVPPTPSCR